MSADVVVTTEVDAAVAVITLDSPANRNALSSVLVSQLRSAMADAAADDDIRAVVLTHTGGTFCAGGDLREALGRGLSPEEATAEGAEAMIGLMSAMLEITKPVIAVVNGHVRAGGFGLLGAADIALAGPAATFALTESRLGLAPSMISIVLLPKMTSRAAGRYFLTGETFTPQQAESFGLVSRALESTGDVSDELHAICEGIRKASPQGLAASKRLTTSALLSDFRDSASARASESAALFASDEAREGMTAFLTKRKAAWDASAS
ncbi:enoyl-CoA hydratase family protein [Gordonia sp. PDNC005]|uniref:enoyl-CoA hydratase family protein n=1 Tax=unclassified Gordonia (in: high G+C Gram-positive bacteria) TaxID=2657482 RepID=UPI00196347AE|nr:enoyl-CoA hydratase family protein [Gordonia sp. PDNC005]QRY61644.1 enoyl-CoA hydratase family protein [Gordonia sp. PDNC005]